MLYYFITYPSGGTEIIVSIAGPTMAPPKKQLYDKLNLEMHIAGLNEDLQFGSKDSPSPYFPLEREILQIFSVAINCLELPGALLKISVLVVSDDGSVYYHSFSTHLLLSLYSFFHVHQMV